MKKAIIVIGLAILMFAIFWPAGVAMWIWGICLLGTEVEKLIKERKREKTDEETR